MINSSVIAISSIRDQVEDSWLAKDEPKDNGDISRQSNVGRRAVNQCRTMRKTKSSMRKTLVVSTFALFTLGLGGCGGVESVFVLGAGLANFIHTDRVPTDYIAEYASGQECNLLKSIEDGGPLCRNSFTRTVVEAPVYCYRTLGEPTCYVSPDPHKTGAQTIK